MSHIEPIARQIDRLVWGVGDAVRAKHSIMAASSMLKPSTFGPLMNLLPMRDHLTVGLVRRRYIYRPEAVMTEFVADLVETQLFTRDDERLVPTPKIDPVIEEVRAAVDAISQDFWSGHEATVLQVSAAARTVLEASDDRDGLVAVAVLVDEASDPFHCLWQRLTGLRLVRNEAHVHAWTDAGLSPGDVEVLTGAWAGTTLQAPAAPSIALRSLGCTHADGSVTDAGLTLRQGIEDATDAGVSTAFRTIDTAAFLKSLQSLPPWK